MIFDPSLDVLEEDIFAYDPKLLDCLLTDRTTKKHIIWATDDYQKYGEEFCGNKEITADLVTGEYSRLIRPRITKSFEEQDSRTKDRAEVFTPCWVCNEQNNLVDHQWFGRRNVFNIPLDKTWMVTSDKVQFPEKGKYTWKKYVDAKRLEISCGEAPYLVSRYDSTTGEKIDVHSRIGLLDRKLRVVGENTDTKEEWYKWALRAFQSVYGYEYQGDNLLLARENLFMTFIEYYQDKFDDNPTSRELMTIARTISWNIWQMDGMKYVVPNSCKPLRHEDITLFGTIVNEEPCPGCKKGNIHEHTGIYSKVFDWRENASLPFIFIGNCETPQKSTEYSKY